MSILISHPINTRHPYYPEGRRYDNCVMNKRPYHQHVNMELSLHVSSNHAKDPLFCHTVSYET